MYVSVMLLLLVLITPTTAQLQLYVAGEFSPIVNNLVDGMKICPSDYEDELTIRCLEEPGDDTATFYLDGDKLRTELRVPYFIAGDLDGVSSPFQDFPTDRPFSIRCETALRVTEITIEVGCSGPEPSITPSITPSPSPSADVGVPRTLTQPSLFLSGMGVGAKTFPLVSGMQICPIELLESEDFSVQCVGGDGTEEVEFYVNGKYERWDNSTPYFIAGHQEEAPNPWKTFPNNGTFRVACRMRGGGGRRISAQRLRVDCQDGTTSNPPTIFDIADPVDNTTTVPTTPEDNCVLITAKGSKLSSGWEEMDNGVAYRLGNTSIDMTEAGDSPLHYKFTSPRSSHYAVVVDMTTTQEVYYNDIWLKLDPGQFRLRRGDSQMVKIGWIKGYHTEFGRADHIISPKHPAHSISSRDVLKEGDEFVISISGRSNQVIVHSILLFPCGDIGCKISDWKDRQDRCFRSASY